MLGEKMEIGRVARFEGVLRCGLPAQDQPRPAAAARRPGRAGQGERRDRQGRRPAHRGVQSDLPHPRRHPRGRRRERAPHRRGDRSRGGQAGGRAAEDRRGSGHRLLQGLRAPRAGLRQGQQEDGRQGPRRGRRSSASAVRPLPGAASPDGSQLAREHLSRAAVRPRGRERERMLSGTDSAAASTSLPRDTRAGASCKLSGEAFAGDGDLGVDPDVVASLARRSPTVVAEGSRSPS